VSGAALVLLNPTAGRGRAGRLWTELSPLLQARWPGLQLHQTTGPGDAERRAAEWARQAEPGPIVILGGDGTVHEMVNGGAAEGPAASLALIPAGTGNDVARNTGVPLNPVAAVDQIGRAGPRLLDLGALEFREPGGTLRQVTFLNSVSMGVSPAANRHARALRRVFPGRLSYTLGGVVALLTAPRRPFELETAGGKAFEGDALNITFANGRGFGGGMRIAPDASPWDGQLDRVVIGRLGLFRSLLALARLRGGGHVGMAEVHITRTAVRTRISSPGAALDLEADGHDYRADGPVTISIRPGALRLLNAAG
jgi:diacylglycerol kinase (ATP)